MATATVTTKSVPATVLVDKKVVTLELDEREARMVREVFGMLEFKSVGDALGLTYTEARRLMESAILNPLEAFRWEESHVPYTLLGKK